MNQYPKTSIKINSKLEFDQEFLKIKNLFSKNKENEDTWESFNTALNNISSWLIKNNINQYVGLAHHIKELNQPINNCILSARTRLSYSAIELLENLSNVIKEEFAPLHDLFMKSIFDLFGRYHSRSHSERCLKSYKNIIKTSKLPRLFKFLHKNFTTTFNANGNLRDYLADCLTVLVAESNLINVKRYRYEIEQTIKSMAKDSNPSVRQKAKICFTTYSTRTPDVSVEFTKLLTDDYKKALGIPFSPKPSPSNSIVPSKSTSVSTNKPTARSAQASNLKNTPSTPTQLKPVLNLNNTASAKLKPLPSKKPGSQSTQASNSTYKASTSSQIKPTLLKKTVEKAAPVITPAQIKPASLKKSGIKTNPQPAHASNSNTTSRTSARLQVVSNSNNTAIATIRVRPASLKNTGTKATSRQKLTSVVNNMVARTSTEKVPVAPYSKNGHKPSNVKSKNSKENTSSTNNNNKSVSKIEKGLTDRMLMPPPKLIPVHILQRRREEGSFDPGTDSRFNVRTPPKFGIKGFSKTKRKQEEPLEQVANKFLKVSDVEKAPVVESLPLSPPTSSLPCYNSSPRELFKDSTLFKNCVYPPGATKKPVTARGNPCRSINNNK